MTKFEVDSDYFSRLHDSIFGKGSWEELEKGVRARNPLFFNLYDSLKVQELIVCKKWWQFWK